MKKIFLTILSFALFNPCKAMDMNYTEEFVHAALAGNLSRLQRLWESGNITDINCTSRANGFTPLDAAVNRGHHDCVKYLLFIGANVNFRAQSGGTALTLAAQSNNYPEIIETLLHSGADFTASTYGGGPLALSAGTWNERRFKCLQVLLNGILARELNQQEKETIKTWLLVELRIRKPENRLPSNCRKLIAHYLIADLLNERLYSADMEYARALLANSRDQAGELLANHTNANFLLKKAHARWPMGSTIAYDETALSPMDTSD